MFDEQTLGLSREAAAEWEAQYRKIVERFGDRATARATPGAGPQIHPHPRPSALLASRAMLPLPVHAERPGRGVLIRRYIQIKRPELTT